MATGHGGARKGAGRPRKIDEELLHQMMDKALAQQEVWEHLAEKVRDGDTAAIKLWQAYRLGNPTKNIDLTSNGQQINIAPIEWVE